MPHSKTGKKRTSARVLKFVSLLLAAALLPATTQAGLNVERQSSIKNASAGVQTPEPPPQKAATGSSVPSAETKTTVPSTTAREESENEWAAISSLSTDLPLDAGEDAGLPSETPDSDWEDDARWSEASSEVGMKGGVKASDIEVAETLTSDTPEASSASTSAQSTQTPPPKPTPTQTVQKVLDDEILCSFGCYRGGKSETGAGPQEKPIQVDASGLVAAPTPSTNNAGAAATSNSTPNNAAPKGDRTQSDSSPQNAPPQVTEVAVTPMTPSAPTNVVTGAGAGNAQNLLLATPAMQEVLTTSDESLFSKKWHTLQGGENADTVRRVVTRMHDFTTIAVGQTKSFSAGRYDAWVVAVDAEGKKSWEQIIGGARDDEAHDLSLLDNGDVIVIGATESVGGSDMTAPVGFLARISADGQLLWKQDIQQEDPHKLTAVELLNAEEGVAFGSDNGAVKMYRFSLTGDRVSKQILAGCDLEVVNAVDILSSGDVVIGGERADFLNFMGSICRLAPNGTVKWQTNADMGVRSALNDIAAVGDDVIGVGFNLGNGGNEQALALRVDSSGNILWAKSLGSKTSDQLLALSTLSDNRILALGSILDQDTLLSQHWIIALSESGEVVESMMGDHEEQLTLMDLAPRSDGRYVVVGRQIDALKAINGYIALMGTQNLSVGEAIAVSETAVAPSVLIPGDGSIITEKPATEILGNVVHNRPIARVFVDGQATRLMQNGAFRTFVSTPMGRTTITVSAIDDLGHVGEAKVDVIRREAVAQTGADLEQIVANTNFGSYHAILIGNQAYGNGIDTLDTPYKDVEVLAALLEDQYGFDVNVLKDATRQQMLSVFNEATEKLSGDDNLLIYYAGHGHYDKDYDQGYWLPVDASAEDRTTWIDSGSVKDMIKRMSAKHVLLVADSCFSGTLLRSANNARSSKFYEIIASRTARLAMTSGNIEPVMDGGGDGHSIFARQFINTLLTDRPIIDGTYLYNSVREPVVTQSGQMPQYSNIRFLESDGGDFLFVKHQK